jgi:hypothetical protein
VEGRQSAQLKPLEHDVVVTHEDSITIEGKQWSIYIHQDETTQIPEVRITSCNVGWVGDSLVNSPEVRVIKRSKRDGIERMLNRPSSPMHNPLEGMEALRYINMTNSELSNDSEIKNIFANLDASSPSRPPKKNLSVNFDEEATLKPISVSTNETNAESRSSRTIDKSESKFLGQMLAMDPKLNLELKYVKHKKVDGYKMKLNNYNMSLLKDDSENVLKLCLAKRPKPGINPDEVKTKYSNMLISIDFQRGSDGEKDVTLSQSDYAALVMMTEIMSN